MKILIVGGGIMGETYARGFLSSQMVQAHNIFILERSAERAEELSAKEIGSILSTPGTYISEMDLVMLAVRPQEVEQLYNDIGEFIDESQLVLSIMAGVEISSIKEGLKVQKIIRAMPNLPAEIGAGMTVYTASPSVTRIELVTVQNLLNASGQSIFVEHEHMINAATAISGSGPAYVFYFMQTLIETATDMGFSLEEAKLLTYQTFRGAVDLFNESDESCEDLLNKVTNEGGTAEAAIDDFDRRQVQVAFQEGVVAALNRAISLSKKKS